jgi:hypothetical protein
MNFIKYFLRIVSRLHIYPHNPRNLTEKNGFPNALLAMETKTTTNAKRKAAFVGILAFVVILSTVLFFNKNQEMLFLL